MAKYTLCPRCELNYILEGQGYCDVCKAELKLGPQLMFSATGDDIAEKILCPICRVNYITEDEQMCSECSENAEFKKDETDLLDGTSEDDETWRQYLDEDEKDEMSKKGDEGDEELISLSQIAEEELEEEEDDEIDGYTNEPTSKKDYDDMDFDIPPIDEDDFLDDDEDDEEDDDDDDDDF